ncbi:MAG: hypothetical protein KDE28_21230 [Anaerolineales bacterium]|nr:hypothetical protein [Anaerolineales bacterium]
MTKYKLARIATRPRHATGAHRQSSTVHRQTDELIQQIRQRPDTVAAREILHLQRTIGNQATHALLADAAPIIRREPTSLPAAQPTAFIIQRWPFKKKRRATPAANPREIAQQQGNALELSNQKSMAENQEILQLFRPADQHEPKANGDITRGANEPAFAPDTYYSPAFSGVYYIDEKRDPAGRDGTFWAHMSGNTRTAAEYEGDPQKEAPPGRNVTRNGGHGMLATDKSRQLRLNDQPNILPFTLYLAGENQLQIEYRSGMDITQQVRGNPNLKIDIARVVSKATGYNVNVRM